MQSETRTILLAAPNPNTRFVCKSMLESEGFRVQETTTIGQTLSVLESEVPDLLITSILLEDGPVWNILKAMPNHLEVVGILDAIQGTTARKLLNEKYTFLELLSAPVSASNLIDLMRVHFGPRYPRTAIAQTADPPAARPGSASSVVTTKNYVFETSEHPLKHESAGTNVHTGAFTRVRSAKGIVEPQKLAQGGFDWHNVGDEGDLRRTAFARVLAKAIHTRFTGAIRLWRERVRKVIHFLDGAPSSVRSNLLYEHLGNVLVRKGVIDQDTNQQSVAAAQVQGKRQGEVLMAMGALTQEELEEALIAQVEERVLEIFGWSSARYHMQVMPPQPDVVPISRSDAKRLVLVGTLEYSSLPRIVDELSGLLPKQLHLATSRRDLATLEIGAEHDPVIDALENGMTLLELVAQFEQHAQVYQVVYALLVLGLVSVE